MDGKVSLRDLKAGGDIVEVSKDLHWRDFEAFASALLSETGYIVTRNLFLTKPRAELDIIATYAKRALAIDCKHWKYSSPAKLLIAIRTQRERAKRYGNSKYAMNAGISETLPALLTLYDDGVHVIEGSPIVPVSRFDSFLLELDGHLHMFEMEKPELVTRPLTDYSLT